MGVELIKDRKGKSHMVFNRDISKDDLLSGDKIDNYEILQVLGSGSFGYVAKAKSRLNHNIYAIKQMNFKESKSKKEMELAENEVTILKNLDHPLITKYYKSFKEGDCLYIVMEFMDNGDLGKLIQGHKFLNKPIEEERLWIIFIQALKSLEFVHSKGLIHRDIKPENLFISTDGTIKLGDFGVSANFKDKNKNNNQNMPKMPMNMPHMNIPPNMQGNIGKLDCMGTVVGTAPFMSPEMIKNTEYDLTTDVYSMGCAFFEAMYWSYPRVPAMDIEALFGGQNLIKLVDVQIKNNKDTYSKELVTLVKKMIEKDKAQRPDSQTILNLFISEFNKKYSKSSSIGSILSCLYSYPDVFQFIKNNSQNIMNNPNSISYAFLYGLNSMYFNNMKEDWKSALFTIRTILSNHNGIYEENYEVNPRNVLSFFIGGMHKELNQSTGNYSNPFSSLFSQDINMQQSNININYSKKEESFNYFLQNFSQNNNSIMSKCFYGNMKTKTVCLNCQLTTYSYNSFNFVTFNLDLVHKYLIKNNYQNLLNQLNIIHCFIIQNETLIQIGNSSKFCRNCKKNVDHSERKQFCTFPKYLIVCLDRGTNCENKTKVFYNNVLDLKNNCDNPNSFINYRLIGLIKRLDINNKEHYVSIYYDYNQNSWIYRDDSQIQKINSPYAHNQGYEEILFYEANMNMNNNNMQMSNMQSMVNSNNNTNMNMVLTNVNNSNNMNNNMMSSMNNNNNNFNMNMNGNNFMNNNMNNNMNMTNMNNNMNNKMNNNMNFNMNMTNMNNFNYNNMNMNK